MNATFQRHRLLRLVTAISATLIFTTCSDEAGTPSGGQSDSGAGQLFDIQAGLDTGTASGSADSSGVSGDSSQADATSSTDSGGADVTGGTCPGAPDCSCSSAKDCDDGLCIDTHLGRRCAVPCAAGCPAKYACAALKDTDGKSKDVCVPAWGRLCQPCDASKDCETAGVSGSLCVDQGKLGHFCGAKCESTDDCPDGYGCQVANSTEGGKAKQCVRLPADGSKDAFGTCACWPASKADGLATKCFANQTDLSGAVVGKCPGQRICNQTGLGLCILVGAKAEVCDGVDNDCNGQVDDNAGGCSAGEVCTAGKCAKGCSPVDGGWSAWVWGACSVSCGGGVRTATRTCTKPAPSCGGKACTGDAKKSESCNTNACAGKDLPKGTTAYSNGGAIVTGLVPSGVTSATVHLWGGGGGGGYPGNGGGGGYVSVKVPVKSGDSLTLRVANGGGAKGGGGG
ncbi:MAG: thrombospondin type-1 domain-containing protein, partial [Myxococcales bacterium]|nr:thrombospondin type-1 domain-containing protein [Myxococcales bacterium]